MQKIIGKIAQEISVQARQVAAAVELLDGGATVPFIARYRKEVTGGLDDIQLRELEARLGYLRELRDRLQTVIKAIDEQGKLTPALLAALHAASTKQELEDLYLPFKLKRRTKGQLAREAGLEPLADALFANPALVPADEALAYVIPMRPVVEGDDKQPDFSTVPAVLDGVRDLLSERWAETPALVQELREWLWHEGLLHSKLMDGKDENNADVAKFRDYFDYAEPISRVPSHRALAVFRGRSLDILDVRLVLPEPERAVTAAAPKTRATPAVSLAEGRIAVKLGWRHQARPADDLIRKCVAWTWRVKLSLSTERDLFARLRGAASIARRVQDPLAELVKIDPKSIGVGQYQHDVNQSDLVKTLDAVVEDCVNLVGVDLNMASVPLLSRVSGLSGSVAKAVVRWRDDKGAFASRQELLKVTGLGPKAFEQSAGFLRIRGGSNPLDMTGVHPETYPVVEQIIVKTGKPVTELMGRADMLKTLRPERFANDKFGVITVRDILGELEKPGRDPRPDFKVARFNDGVQDIRDLKEGMVLTMKLGAVAARSGDPRDNRFQGTRPQPRAHVPQSNAMSCAFAKIEGLGN